MVSHMKGGKKIFQRVKLNRKVLLVLDLSMKLSPFDPWPWFPAVLLILFGLGKGQALIEGPTSDCVEIGKTHCFKENFEYFYHFCRSMENGVLPQSRAQDN